jgi:hypothetical protein
VERARPTLRCLHDDLKVARPSADVPLDEINHPLLAKTHEQFADPATPHERIAAIDDEVFFKVKVQRWRGAVWTDHPSADVRVWLVAAGWREDGATTDFYAALAASARAARSRRNAGNAQSLTSDTYTWHLLPDDTDRARYRAESAARFERTLAAAVRDLCRASLLDGREHTATVGGAVLGIQVRANQGHETYVAVRIIGSVPSTLAVVVLDLIPGCDLDGWFPEYSLPERPLDPAEQAWSNLMDPTAAAKLLDEGI